MLKKCQIPLKKKCGPKKISKALPCNKMTHTQRDLIGEQDKEEISKSFLCFPQRSKKQKHKQTLILNKIKTWREIHSLK